MRSRSAPKPLAALAFTLSALAPATGLCGWQAPTEIPTPTPTPWPGTGHWFRDTGLEQQVVESGGQSGAHVAMAATIRSSLAPEAEGTHDDLPLSLVCTAHGSGAWVPGIYLVPGSGTVPNEIDTYTMGIWSTRTGGWVDKIGDLQPLAIGGESSVYEDHRGTVLRTYFLLERAASSRLSEGLVFAVKMWSSENPGVSLSAGFDVWGLRHAVAYLRCW